jgi:hypothetical protein
MLVMLGAIAIRDNIGEEPPSLASSLSNCQLRICRSWPSFHIFPGPPQVSD